MRFLIVVVILILSTGASHAKHQPHATPAFAARVHFHRHASVDHRWVPLLRTAAPVRRAHGRVKHVGHPHARRGHPAVVAHRSHIRSGVSHVVVHHTRVHHRRHLVLPVRDGSIHSGAGQEGYASWYGSGARTANGERYLPMGATCAHRTLPFGTVLRVTALQTGNQITCRVNDRGPFIRGRILDLSRGSAIALGIIGAGVARVRIE